MFLQETTNPDLYSKDLSFWEFESKLTIFKNPDKESSVFLKKKNKPKDSSQNPLSCMLSTRPEAGWQVVVLPHPETAQLAEIVCWMFLSYRNNKRNWFDFPAIFRFPKSTSVVVSDLTCKQVSKPPSCTDVLLYFFSKEESCAEQFDLCTHHGDTKAHPALENKTSLTKLSQFTAGLQKEQSLNPHKK